MVRRNKRRSGARPQTATDRPPSFRSHWRADGSAKTAYRTQHATRWRWPTSGAKTLTFDSSHTDASSVLRGISAMSGPMKIDWIRVSLPSR